MFSLRYFPLVLKYVVRHRTRSLLTISGVAMAMFLFYSVQAMQQGVVAATEQSADDSTLVVYRQDRYCPYTSNLPQDYARKIARIPGVKSVVPIKIVINNCRTSLDSVAFRGVPDDAFDRGFLDRGLIVDGSLEQWKRRTDAAIVGERLAARRGLKVGDRIELAGLAVSVAGILRSREPQDQNVAYVHLGFVQRSAGADPGIVTQFNVVVQDPSLMESVATAVDAEFRNAQEPTSTWSQKSFVARATKDIIEIVGFARWLGWGSLVCVFALVANAILLSVRERIQDHAVMETLGYTPSLIAQLVVLEGVLLSVSGALIGLLGGVLLTSLGTFSLSVEGLSINLQAGTGWILIGLATSVFMGALAGFYPAWQASRREIAACFRAV